MMSAAVAGTTSFRPTRSYTTLRDVTRRCVDECKSLGYNPAYFVQMLDDRGGLATTKKLINDNTPSDGFTRLWELRRLDLTVEAVALRSPYSSLLTQAERLKARRRLEEYGYKP